MDDTNNNYLFKIQEYLSVQHGVIFQPNKNNLHSWHFLVTNEDRFEKVKFYLNHCLTSQHFATVNEKVSYAAFLFKLFYLHTSEYGLLASQILYTFALINDIKSSLYDVLLVGISNADIDSAIDLLIEWKLIYVKPNNEGYWFGTNRRLVELHLKILGVYSNVLHDLLNVTNLYKESLNDELKLQLYLNGLLKKSIKDITDETDTTNENHNSNENKNVNNNEKLI